nr:lipoate protein ligase C-terminal domain-containing protein [Mycoplasmopsis bovis]
MMQWLIHWILTVKKIEAKGVKSIRQRVAPLSNYFDEQYRNLDIFEFKDLVIKKLFGVDDLSKVKRYELTEQDWAQVDELVNTKYKNWDWNYGLSPRYEYNRDARLAIGTINFSLAVEGQRIEKIKISGDFFAKKNITELEKSLVGVKLDYDELLSAINKANLDEYFFNNISAEEVVKVILGEVDDE